MSPNTFLVHRALLALHLREDFGIDFEHKHFSMLARTAFRQNPPKPKTVPSWSLDEALQSLESRNIPRNDKLARSRKALFLQRVPLLIGLTN